MTKKVKNGENLKKIVPEAEFVKMIKSGSVDQLRALQAENLKLKEALVNVVKRIKDLSTKQVIDPLSKASP